MKTSLEQLTAHFGAEKAEAILIAVGEFAAAQIAHALDFEASEKREAEKRQRAIRMAKERRQTA